MTSFDITIRPPGDGRWAWTWEMTWYEPTAPLCMAYRSSVEQQPGQYPDRQAAKEAAERFARHVAETVDERYTYEPTLER